jgi:hypothetical protein
VVVRVVLQSLTVCCVHRVAVTLVHIPFACTLPLCWW